ncbi:uncharacterized protein LOC125704069 [Brienomyrus brachyistius]|uniref:uncharacterized protein LOC125704069 n=1 Tax=Brienomyrus brachyistius TaxID=42636 RepID=UPI0020B26D64|nr:uncharacterized protein LOC125704069 [Brienomyrus brachyistius]
MTDDFPKVNLNIYGEYEIFNNWAAAVLDSPDEKQHKQKRTSKAAGNNKKHKTISEEQLDIVEGEKHEENTKTTAWAVNVFNDWLKAKNTSLDEIWKQRRRSGRGQIQEAESKGATRDDQDLQSNPSPEPYGRSGEISRGPQEADPASESPGPCYEARAAASSARGSSTARVATCAARAAASAYSSRAAAPSACSSRAGAPSACSSRAHARGAPFASSIDCALWGSCSLPHSCPSCPSPRGGPVQFDHRSSLLGGRGARMGPLGDPLGDSSALTRVSSTLTKGPYVCVP